MIISHISLSRVFGTLFIPLSIPLFINKLTLNSLMKSAINCQLFRHHFPRKNSSMLLAIHNNSFIPGLDKLSWSHLKFILKQDECLCNIIKITDACINLGHWLNRFKCSSMVVIPKPNKQLYNYPKSFRPIVLLNILGKLIEKVIGERLQFHVVANDFIYLSQLEALKFKSTTDVDITLTHIIHSRWVKNNTTSTLAFDIT